MAEAEGEQSETHSPIIARLHDEGNGEPAENHAPSVNALQARRPQWGITVKSDFEVCALVRRAEHGTHALRYTMRGEDALILADRTEILWSDLPAFSTGSPDPGQLLPSK